MNAKENKMRRIWTNCETIAFLRAYEKRQYEFDHPRKKKFAMSNVLEDLLAAEVLTQPTTTEMLATKLKNLKKALKETSDNNARTGASASKAPFEDIMEELFGKRPEIRNTHTLNLSGTVIAALPSSRRFSQEEEEEEWLEELSISPWQGNEIESSTLEEQNPLSPMPSSRNEIELSTLQEQNQLSPTPSGSQIALQELNVANRTPPTSSKSKIKKTAKTSAKERYFQGKINLKREMAIAKNNIIQEYHSKKLKKMDEMEKGRNERLEKKLKAIKEMYIC